MSEEGPCENRRKGVSAEKQEPRLGNSLPTGRCLLTLMVDAILGCPSSQMDVQSKVAYAMRTPPRE